MIDRFTSEQAFDAADCGEPIMMTPAAARHLVDRVHDSSWSDWLMDCDDKNRLYHADAILAWLGY